MRSSIHADSQLPAGKYSPCKCAFVVFFYTILNIVNVTNKLQNLIYVRSYYEILINAKLLQYFVDVVVQNITGLFVLLQVRKAWNFNALLMSIEGFIYL